MSSIIILQFRQQRLPDSSQIIHNQLLTIHLSHLSRSSFNEIAIINRIKLLKTFNPIRNYNPVARIIGKIFEKC